jgi:tripartite-type tricarboxylate transporter receptor subunit TctC
MRINKMLKAASLVMGLMSATMMGAQAQTAEEFYGANTLNLIVSAAPGGAADFFARTFAPYFARHIPGNPKVVVTNQPGAGGMVTAVQLQNTLAADGLNVALLQRNNFYLPLINNDNTTFDPREVTWLGSLAKEKYTVILWNDAPIDSAEDLFTTPVRIGATGFANENRTLAAMMNDHFGTQFDIIAGYEGNEALALAIERGEVKGRLVTDNNLTSGNEAGWFADGTIKVPVQLGVERSSILPDVPNIMKFSEDPAVLALANFMLAPLEASRPLAVSSKVPADRLEALMNAFDAAAADPEFLEIMAKMKSTVDPISGAEVEAIIAGLYATPEDVIADVAKLLKSE